MPWSKPLLKMAGRFGFFAVLATGACAGRAIDVGPAAGGAPDASGAPGASGAPSASGAPGNVPPACTDETPLPEWPSTSACASSSDLPLVGSWRGYVETLGPPWDALWLNIKGANQHGLCGTLRVGDVAPPLPASDPDHAYPAGTSNFDPQTKQIDEPTVIPGYELTLLGGTTNGTRVRFSISRTEGYKSWCELQTSYGGEGTDMTFFGPTPETCACVPNWIFSGDDVTDQAAFSDPHSSAQLAVSFRKAMLCIAPGSGACTCNASGCTGRNDSVSAIGFDLRFDGDAAEGTYTQRSELRVHFTRSP